MSLRPEELELHRQLLAAFDEYIRLNLRWETKGYRADGRRTRRAIRNIMDIAYLRWQEIIVRMHEMEVENGTQKAEKILLKQPGLAMIQHLHAAKNKKRKRPKPEGDGNTST
jgi:hypothetical protein